MADEIAPLPLRRGGFVARGQSFHLPLLLRAAPRWRMTIVTLTASGAAGPFICHAEDQAGQSLARIELAEGAPAPLVVPPGTARFVIEGAAEALRPVELGYFPVDEHYPLGRILLKLHVFRHSPRPEASTRGLSRWWRTASAGARHLRAQISGIVINSELRRTAGRPAYLAYRERFETRAPAITAPATAPRVVFITALGEGLPDLQGFENCAQALREQTDRAFDWLVSVPSAQLSAARTKLTPLLEGVGRLVSHDGADEAVGITAALAAAEGPDDTLVCLLDPAGQPARGAVAMVREAFAAHPDCQLLYTDEERGDPAGLPIDGVFKPAFNRHLLEAYPYFGALTLVRLGRARAIGFRAGFGTATPYDFVLRYLDGVPTGAILHLPRIAYSGPDRPAGFPDAASATAAAAALGEHLGVAVETTSGDRFLRPLFPVPETQPKVSIVIPTRDRADLMRMTLTTLIGNTRYRNFEIIIVDNGSVQPETFALFEETKTLWPQTKVVSDDGDFNYPRICNNGVAEMTGDLLLLLNNDIEVIDGGWLDEMVALIMRRDHGVRTGVVGAKLLFPDRTIQHAGVIVGLFRNSSHWFEHCRGTAEGLEGRLLVRENLSAVTGACLLIRKDVWDEIGPLDAVRFAEDCNDIDLCLRARHAGYGVVLSPFAQLIHHESASRGAVRSAEHNARLREQRARFDQHWHAHTLVDPNYNPNLRRHSLFAALALEPEGPRTARTEAI